MAYIFTDATLLGYQGVNNFLGEGLFSVNSKKNISIKGILDSRQSNLISEGVSQSIEKIKILESGAFNVYEDVFINGMNLGKGRIINVSFPNPNPIRIAEYNYDIEIINSGDFTFAPNDSMYGSYIQSISGVILNLAENFAFNYESNGDYTYNHQIDIQYYDDNTDITTKSKDLASNLFNDNISFGLLSPFSGIYANLRNKKNYFTETYNLTNKSCSFSKNIKINKNNNLNYTNTVIHTLTFDPNGKITVTEQGDILGLDNTLNYTAENYFQTAIANSYTRCQSILDVYSNKYNLNIYGNLYNQPFNLGKTFDPYSNKLKYSISYVNNIAFEGNVINTYEIVINKDNKNIENYSENGQLIQVGQIGQISNLNQIKTKYQEAQNRASQNYPTFKSKSNSLSLGYIVGTNYDFNNQFSYSIEKTNDRSVLENDAYFKFLEVKATDQPPFGSYKEYIIPNKDPKNMLFLSGNNVEIGNRSVSINGILNRPTTNIWNGPINFPLSYLKNLAVSEAFNLVTTETYIDGINYNYNSENNFSFNLNLRYLKTSGT